MRTYASERVEAHPASIVYHEQVARYRFAADQLRAGRTLDVAIGIGIGVALLASYPGVWVDGDDAGVFVAGCRGPRGS